MGPAASRKAPDVALDLTALRAHFPSLASVSRSSTARAGPRPRPGGRASRRPSPARCPTAGPSLESERNADDAVQAFRAAFADLLNAVPRASSTGGAPPSSPTTSPGTWPRPGGGRRDRAQRARPRRQRPALGAGRGSGRRHRALVGFDLATAELDRRRSRRRCPLRPHPAGRGHRRLEPARHHAAAAPDRRAAHEVGALLFVDGVHYAAHAPGRPAALWAPTSSSARPTSSWGRTARCWPPPRPAGVPAARTSCCPPPTRCRSGSSSAPCRTS